ncbi:MAG: helix-turn-helix domain-containing protein [Geminicoccaceae bacterium]|nr:helix-turn-helix domain-containing protein [Geminicoccaceae bacterium]
MHTTPRGHSAAARAMALKLYASGVSMNRTGHLVGTSCQSVMRWVRRAGAAGLGPRPRRGCQAAGSSRSRRTRCTITCKKSLQALAVQGDRRLERQARRLDDRAARSGHGGQALRQAQRPRRALMVHRRPPRLRDPATPQTHGRQDAHGRDRAPQRPYPTLVRPFPPPHAGRLALGTHGRGDAGHSGLHGSPRWQAR